MLVVRDDDDDAAPPARLDDLPDGVPVLWLHNKIDRAALAAREERRDDGVHLWLSARTGDGLDRLRAHLRERAGADAGGEGTFSARTRHLDALDRGGVHLATAATHLQHGLGELAAEELRLAQHALGEITGRVDADALLGRIFADFCIGK